jgi:hypothetical protein
MTEAALAAPSLGVSPVLEPVDPRQDADLLLARGQGEPLHAADLKLLAEGLRRLARSRQRAAADAILSAIDRPDLRNRAWEGVTLRCLATEALLDMGHPFALEVPPEALEAAMEERASAKRRRERPWKGLGVFALGTLVPVLWALWKSPPGSDLPLGLAVFSVALGFIPALFAFDRGDTTRRGVGMFLTALLGAFELWIGLALVTPLSPLLVPGGVLHLLSLPLFFKTKSPDVSEE